MRIAFIVHGFPVLSETFVLNQITGLLDLGHDVEIFAIEPNYTADKVHADIEKYRLMDRVRYIAQNQNKTERVIKAVYLIITNLHKDLLKLLRSLNVRKYGYLASSLTLLSLINWFLDRDFDIIHCHYGHIGNIGACMKQIGIRSKLVTMFHGYDIRLGIESNGSIYRDLFKFGDCFLALSDHSYKNLIRFGADPHKISIHPVGIDVNKFSYRWQFAIPECPDTIIITTVARLVEVKGLKYGIRAISKLLTDNPRLRLKYQIIGEGQLKGELRTLVQELGLDDIVQFLGAMRQEEVIGNLQQTHIFLHPSIAEALPVVLMEAQAVGLPIVTTSVGGIHEIVTNGKSGFVVPAKDPDALVEKLEYLIERPEIWPEMGRSGRRIVEEKYDVEKLNRRLVAIYQSLLSENADAKEVGSAVASA